MSFLQKRRCLMFSNCQTPSLYWISFFIYYQTLFANLVHLNFHFLVFIFLLIFSVRFSRRITGQPSLLHFRKQFPLLYRVFPHYSPLEHFLDFASQLVIPGRFSHLSWNFQIFLFDAPIPRNVLLRKCRVCHLFDIIQVKFVTFNRLWWLV